MKLTVALIFSHVDEVEVTSDQPRSQARLARIPLSSCKKASFSLSQFGPWIVVSHHGSEEALARLVSLTMMVCVEECI
jgi:hypothetical protein